MLASVEQVRVLAEGILRANGVPADHARTQAGLFLEAEMRAIPSHGLLRLRRVIERIHAGLSVPGASGKQVWTARATVRRRKPRCAAISSGPTDACGISLKSEARPAKPGKSRQWRDLSAEGRKRS